MNFNKAAFYNSIRGSLFGGSLGQTTVENTEIILDYWLANHSDKPFQQLAYVLATVRHEVGAAMQPVRETFAKSDAQARAKLAGKKYGKSVGPHSHAYYGRGYVQLTWLKNYRKQEQKLGIPLVENPDLALDPRHGIRILVEGMLDGDFNGRGHGLGHYVNETEQDYIEARRTVNILDKASHIAGLARKFENAIAAAVNTPVTIGDLVVVESEDAEVDDNTDPTIEELTKRIDALTAAVAQLSEIAADKRTNVPVVVNDPVEDEPEAEADVELAERDQAIAAILGAIPGSTPLGKSIKSLSPEAVAAVLTAFERAGVITPADGLTPVNAALGQTVGKALDGKKTVLGTIGMLATTMLPAAAKFIPGLAPVVGAVEAAAPVIVPIASALAGWGVLGKIDKWLHKPVNKSFKSVAGKD